MRRGRRLAPGLGLALALLAPAAPSAGSGDGADWPVEFLHLEANEGESSGGHAALRIGEWTYHFQHRRGLLVMRRDLWPRFDYVYRTLQNRGIDATRIAAGAGTRALLRRGFQRRYLVLERRLALLAALESDVGLLAALRAQARGLPGPAGFELDGAGLFGPPGAPAPRSLAALGRRIEARHGRGFLAARRRQVGRSLALLDPSAPPPRSAELEDRVYPTAAESFSRRYAEHWSALAALELLEHPRPLAPQALRGDPGGALDAAARDRLRAQAGTLAESLSRLVASRRPDWGQALLLGLARLAALERSLESGRLLLLDALPRDAEALGLDSRRRAALPALSAEARRELARARGRALEARVWRESDWSTLEHAATRLGELRRAAAGAPELRVYDGAGLPQARARVAPLPALALEAAQLEDRLAAARAGLRRYRAALEARQGYDLVARNCVSEIFRSIELALVADGEGGSPRAASRRHLGGYVDPAAGLHFVPFVASRRVRQHYAVAGTRFLPSYRRWQLASMARRESAWRVALRESNAFSSSLHRRSEDDGFFVFFSDGPRVLRPLLGAGNLIGALGWSGLGLVRLPVDRGRALRAGLEGALFSLPELVTVNLRKGRNEYVPPRRRPPS